jgi:hypothetical protein
MTHIMELQDGIFCRNVPGDKLEACAGRPGGDLCEVVAQLLLHLYRKFCVLSLLCIPNSIIPRPATANETSKATRSTSSESLSQPQ